MQPNLFDCNNGEQPLPIKANDHSHAPEIVQVFENASNEFLNLKKQFEAARQMISTEFSEYSEQRIFKALNDEEKKLCEDAVRKISVSAANAAVGDAFKPELKVEQPINSVEELSASKLYQSTLNEWVEKSKSFHKHIAAKCLARKFPADDSSYALSYCEDSNRYILKLKVESECWGRKLAINFDNTLYEFIESLHTANSEYSTNVLGNVIESIEGFAATIAEVFTNDGSDADKSLITVQEVNFSLPIGVDALRAIREFVDTYKGRERYY